MVDLRLVALETAEHVNRNEDVSRDRITASKSMGAEFDRAA